VENGRAPQGIASSSPDGACDLLAEVIRIVGDGAVVTGNALEERVCSFWDPSPLQARALIRPRTTQELSEVMALCHQAAQPVVTHGGLTGCVQGTIAGRNEVVISLERMTAIEEIDPVGRTLTVQAGAILKNVQQAVADQHLYLPLDLGARGSCTIGGNVSTNAGGINVIRYGMMRDLVLGLEAVLADGTVVSSLNHMLKNNAGYDLKQLFIGSEGTLGIVTRVVLKLKEAVTSRDTVMVGLDSFASVTKLLNAMERGLGGSLSAYEVMWGDYFRAVTEPRWHHAPMSRGYPFYVIAEANGSNRETDTAQFLACLESAADEKIVVDAIIPKSDAEREAIWAIRENFEAVMQAKPTFLYDVSLPIRNMDEYIELVKTGLRRRWPAVQCHVIGHIGDGNLHLFVSPGEGEDTLHVEADEEVYKPLSRYNGSVSAEHGIGLEKKRWLEISRTPTEISLMRLLKRTLDPNNLLNRGKVFDA
jgi:FAD/FMN-containing dehydrogenase